MTNLLALTEKSSQIAIVLGNMRMVMGIEAMMTAFQSHEVKSISDSNYNGDGIMLSYLTIRTTEGKKLYLPKSGINSDGHDMNLNELNDAINEYVIR